MASKNLKALDSILDCSCTYHLTHNKRKLWDNQELHEKKVMIGNSHYCYVASIEFVSIKMVDDVVKLLDVYMCCLEILFVITFLMTWVN